MSKARPTNQGLVFLRRSGDQQETSIDKQVTWALKAAQQKGVAVDMTHDDVQHMLEHKLHTYKSIRLDDAITGGDLERAGLSALIADCQRNRKISHVFAYKRDRLGRPDNAADMVTKELQLLQAGVTLIFSDGESEPRPGGEAGIEQQVQMLIGYHMSGQFRRDLAEQMISTQLWLANAGYSVGGSAPYGFVRALVDPAGNVLEYLPKGKFDFRHYAAACNAVSRVLRIFRLPRPARPACKTCSRTLTRRSVASMSANDACGLS